MATQELLEVEDRELVILLEREELAKRCIRIDRLLVHELVLLAVRRDGLGDIGAADLRVLGLAEEREELIRDRNRRREDAGLGRGTLNNGLLVLTLAIRLLGEAGRKLLERLGVRGRLRVQRLDLNADLVLARERLGDEGREILIRRRGSGISGRGRGSGNNGRRDDGSGSRNGGSRNSGGSRLRGLGDLGGGSRNGGSDCRGSGNNGLSGLCGDRLLGRLRGGGGNGGSAHFDSVGGSI